MLRVGLLGFPIDSRSKELCNKLRARSDVRLYSTDRDYSESKEFRPDRLLDAIFSDRTAFCVVLFSNAYLEYLWKDQSNERTALFNIINTRPNFLIPIACENGIKFPIWLNVRFQKLAILTPETFGDLINERLEDLRQDSKPTGYSHILDLIRSTFGPSSVPVSDEVSLVSERVGYQLFLSENPLYRAKTYVCHLYGNIDLIATKANFEANFGGVVEGTHLSILINPKGLELSRDATISATRAAFGTEDVEFIDDFIYRQVAEAARPKAALIEQTTNHFITPALIETDGTEIKDGMRFLTNWLWTTSSTNNTLAIKGPGGVGKTTLARKLVGSIPQSNDRFVVYLDAHVLVEALARHPDIFSNFSLYSIYKLFARTQQFPDMGEERFRWAFDSGRIPVIIDGLDELIPRLPHGKTAAEFINSIAGLFGGLNYGKVLFTCRNKFWEDSSIALGIRTLEVQPFTEQQVEEFVKARFRGNGLKARQVSGLLSELNVSYENGLLPYILELSARMVEQEGSQPIKVTEIADDIAHELTDQPVDHIVYNICKRENAKFNVSLGVGDQFKCFIELALTKQGEISEEQLAELIATATSRRQTQLTEKTFRNHPLLASSGNVRFAFDFIREFFLSLSVTQALQLRRDLRFEDIHFLSPECRLGSNLLAAVSSRVPDLTSEASLQLETLRETVVKHHGSGDLDEQMFRDCIATLFNIGLQILIRAKRSDATSLTAYMKNFFGQNEAGEIEYFTIMNIDPDRYPIRFQFNGCRLISAYIAGYNDFVRCGFDAQTLFRRSVITAFNLSERVRTEASADNFARDCTLDPALAAIFDRQQQKSERREQIALKQVQSFLRDFRYDGSFRKNRREIDIKSYYQGFAGISSDRFVSMMLEAGVIAKAPHDCLRISDTWVKDVEDLLDQNLISERMTQLIRFVTSKV